MVIETRRASSTAGSAGKTTTDKKLSDTKEKCGSCNANVKEKDRGLLCNICRVWFHSACENVNNALYEAIVANNSNSLHWFCSGCNKVATPLLTNMSSIIKQQEKIQIDLENARDDILTNAVDIAAVQDEVQSFEVNLRPVVEANKLDIVNLAKDVKTLQNTLNNFVSEPSELDKRKFNLVISGLPENNPDNTSDLVTLVVDKLNLEGGCPFKDVRRLGKIRDDGRPRLTRITVTSLQHKEQILKKCKSMRNLASDGLPYNPATVYITNDQTNLQRLRAFKAREHRRRRRDLDASTNANNGETGQDPGQVEQAEQ